MHVWKRVCVSLKHTDKDSSFLPSARRRRAALLNGVSEQVRGGAAPGGEQRTDAFRVAGVLT